MKNSSTDMEDYVRSVVNLLKMKGSPWQSITITRQEKSEGSSVVTATTVSWGGTQTQTFSEEWPIT